MDNNDTRWYVIPGYNGYEYRFSDQAVRSMKFFNTNPYGKLLVPKVTKKSGTYYYLSNDRNEKTKLYIEDIERLVNSNPNKNIDLRGEFSTNISSRNLVTRKRVVNNQRVDPIFPKFTIIDK